MRRPLSTSFLAASILLAAPSIAAPDAVPTPPSAISFGVSTDRESYRFGEPVWLYVRVANDGAEPFRVENPYCSRTSTRIEITNAAAGQTIPMTGPASCASTVFETIPSGSEMLYAFELLEFYGVDGADEYPFGILPPGRYEVRYRTHDRLSPAVSFAVDALDGESSEAFHAYIEIVAAVRPTNLREAPGRFRAYVEGYPESSFAPALLCRAGVLSDLFFDSADAFEDFVRLIELYPDSGYVSVAARHLAYGMGRQRDRRRAFLERIPHELPGTLAAELAHRALARLGS